jgi:type II secretory pathway component GspD/PulD (secretin)
MMLASLKTMNNVQIVERPNIIVQNHSIGYIAVGDENSYVKSVSVTPGKQNPDGSYTAPTYQYNIGNYTDGLQFVVRVDKYLHKDRIGVSLAPILAYTKVVPGPQQVQLLQRKIRQAMSVVSIKNGDIIVLGGMKSLKGDGSGNESGILPSIFGMNSSSKQKIETIFLLRVTQINHASDTDKYITPATGDLINAVKVK